MPCPRPQIVLCQKTTWSHIAVCLPETLIQASHTPLHSVLSSVSLPHYSSSIFKREYDLLQLVCLEANLSRSLQWAASPRVFDSSLCFISPFVSVFYLRCVFGVWFWHMKTWRAEDSGAFCIYIWTMWQMRKQQVEILKDTLEGVGGQKWSFGGRGGKKNAADGKVKECKFFLWLKRSKRYLGRSKLLLLMTARDNTSSQTQRVELVSIWDGSVEDHCLPSQPFLL